MKKKIPLEELAGLPEFYHPVVSPDGEKVAFYYDKSGRNELYVLETKNGELTQLSDGQVPRNARWPIMWHPDGNKIYYHKDKAGNEQNDIYLIDLEGNAEPIVEANGQCIIADVSDDGRHLLFLCDRDEQLNLFVYDGQKDELDKLTEYSMPVTGATMAPSGKKIAYVTNESDNLKNRDVYICDLDGSNKRKLDIGEKGYKTEVQEWSASEDKLLIQDNSTDMTRAGVYDFDREEVNWLGSDKFDEHPTCFSPDGDEVLGLRMKEATGRPIVFTEDGSVKNLGLTEGICQFPLYGRRSVFTSSNSFILSYATSDKRKELLQYDLTEDKYKVLLKAEYGNIDPGSFVESEYITYKSEDGLSIGALLYDSGERPSPAVVMVHGGPHAQSMKNFNLYAQFLVNRGYTVLQPNYRGSTGKGREFKRKIFMDWGGKEQDDIAHGARWLKERDLIDEDRIAVFGGSYGGYSVYMQMVNYPDLYATGVAWVGITDLHKLYEGDMPHFQAMLEEEMGDPEENYDLWRDRSAIEHVERMKRPLLIVHGVNDPRCPIEQARIFKEKLEDRGWEEGEDFEYEELGEEGHGSTDIRQKIRVFKIMENYLGRRL